MRMLQIWSMSGYTKKDNINNEIMGKEVGLTPIYYREVGQNTS